MEMMAGMLLKMRCPTMSVFLHKRTVPHSYTTSLLFPGIVDNVNVFVFFVFLLYWVTGEPKVQEYFLIPIFDEKAFILFCGVNRLGHVSFHRVLNLLNYMSNETETSPVTEALLQLNNIFRLLDKRQDHILVARMKVQTHTTQQ